MIRDIAWNDGDFMLSASGDVALVYEHRAIAQDLIARLISPRGSHWAHPDDGLDSQKFIQATADELTLLEFRQDLEREAIRDARVFRARAEIQTPSLTQGRVKVTARLRNRAFALTLPTPTSFSAEREYGTLFKVDEDGGVLELAGNRPGDIVLDDDGFGVSFPGMNPAHFRGEDVYYITVGGSVFPIEVVDLHVS